MSCKQLTQKEYLEKCVLKHGTKYDYSKTIYTGAKSKVIIICKEHGEFSQEASSHSHGAGCRNCQYKKLNEFRTKPEAFREQLKLIYGSKYTYENTEYTGQKNKVKVNCKKHGVFEQWPAHIVRGIGCQKCSKEFLGFTRSAFIKRARGRKAIFYIIRCFNESECFYKVGITSQSIKERYRKTKDMPYCFEIVKEIFGDPGEIWDLEVATKRKLKPFKFTPGLSFGGSVSECFSSIDGIF